MEVGPLLYKKQICEKKCIMCVLFTFLLLYLLEISFPHIIVYSLITGVVTWIFYMQFTILWNMELGPFLHAHNRWNPVFLVLFVWN